MDFDLATLTWLCVLLIEDPDGNWASQHFGLPRFTV